MGPRSRFFSDRCRLDSTRRSMDPAVGRVLRRRLGGIAARRIKSARRSRASSRFCACVRCRRASITITPSAVTRLPASASSRSRTSGASAADRLASNRSCTAVATLFTFCPPGPDARTKRSSISESSITIASVTRSTSSPRTRAPGPRAPEPPSPRAPEPPRVTSHSQNTPNCTRRRRHERTLGILPRRRRFVY